MMTNTNKTGCGRAYCTSGICSKYTKAEQREIKALALDALASKPVNVAELGPRLYDGVAMLMEAGRVKTFVTPSADGPQTWARLK